MIKTATEQHTHTLGASQALGGSYKVQDPGIQARYSPAFSSKNDKNTDWGKAERMSHYLKPKKHK